LRLDVRVEVVRNEVVVTVLDDAVDKCGETVSVAELSLTDNIENSGQLGIKLILRVDMSVSQILNVFGKVTEEEDVLLANLTGNFDLVKD
jgi:hypothetical protein